MLDDTSDVLIYRVHLLAHYLLVLGLLVVRDESLNHIPAWALRIDVLGQSHTACHRTIYQYAYSARVRESHIIQRLHKHSQSPHQQGCYDKQQHYAGGIKVCEPFAGQQVQTIFSYQCQHQCHSVAIHHSHQVYEARVAHKSRVGVEQAESGYAQYHENQQSVDYLQCVFKECYGVMKHPVSHHSTEHHHSAVYHENAPIW